MKTLLATLFLSLLNFTSCLTEEEDCELYICDSGPFFADLDIHVTINSENPSVPIEVFQGNVEAGVLLFRDTLTSSRAYWMEAGISYSATARYNYGDHTVIAFNGTYLDTANGECDCPEDFGYSRLDMTLRD